MHKLTLSEYEQQTETLDQELLQQQPEVQMQEGPLQQNNPLGESVDPGLLDEGNSPSRWNRCRFQCAICLKTNSEKRHTREHITKAHQMSMQEYEEQYGDCEVHTEFFRCAACSSELKHNMKNIFVHLSKGEIRFALVSILRRRKKIFFPVHSMNPEEYEDQYGRLPEAAETLPHHDQEPLADGADVTLDDDDEGDFEGFGAHFLLDDASADSGGGGQATTMTAPMPLHPPMPAPSPPPQQGLKSQNQLQRCRQPPRADVVNTSCKFCRLCDRTFKSRSIFLRHCRNVHAMKIRFAGKEKGNVAPLATGTKKKSSLLSPRLREYLSKATAKSAPSSRKKLGNGRLDCEFCGKARISILSYMPNHHKITIFRCLPTVPTSAATSQRPAKRERQHSPTPQKKSSRTKISLLYLLLLLPGAPTLTAMRPIPSGATPSSRGTCWRHTTSGRTSQSPCQAWSRRRRREREGSG